MNGLQTVLFLLGLQLSTIALTWAMPMTASQQAAPTQVNDNNNNLPSDYSRFFSNYNNISPYDKKSAQAPALGNNFYPSQWLSRQLAPKFKREFNPYSTHDKRMDDLALDDFYAQLKPNRFEWNFNRL